MRLKIEHRTRYAYSLPVRAASQMLRLTPGSTGSQSIESWQVTAAGNLWPWQDQFGNTCHHHFMATASSELALTASGIVETHAHDGITADLPPYVLPDHVYLRETPYTAPDQALEALAEQHRPAITADPDAGLVALMNAVHTTVRYDTNCTDVSTNAAEALALGRGVCQDHAHVIIALCRLIGIPARYVSGYLCVAGNETPTASHAWAEAKLPGRGWLSLDGANDTVADDRYVRLGVGFDYRSASPVSGVRNGGGEETMAVGVKITMLDQRPGAQPAPPMVRQAGLGAPGPLAADQ